MSLDQRLLKERLLRKKAEREAGHRAQAAQAGMDAVAEHVRQGDVASLVRSFSLASDWDTRETIAVALREVYRQHSEDGRIRMQLRSSLPDLLTLCRAETSGGSYRQNCINAADSLLQEVK